MLSLFQRASIRAGINPQYSHGFNPRPKISLPLPRPVGVESDDELLMIAVCVESELNDPYETYEILFLKNLSSQLPDGCELQSINIVREKPSFQPCCASYIFTLHQEYLNEKLENRINSILSSKSLVVSRSIDNKGRPRNGPAATEHEPGGSVAKKIDLRDFLISIITEHNSIIVKYKISSAGTIRIQEIMQLLELETEMFAHPIKRTNVQWQGIWQEKCSST